jgi:GAF domain-containing protein
VVPVLGTALPGCAEAGVALLRDGSPLTVAATHPVVRAITVAQYRHGSGPCLTATATGRPVLADDDDPRDPDAEWRTLSRAVGLTATLAVPLPVPDDVAGALIFHRTAADPWPATATATASALAGYVGQALTVLVRQDSPEPDPSP